MIDSSKHACKNITKLIVYYMTCQLILKLVLIGAENDNINKFIELNKDAYNGYMYELSGHFTEEKEQFIEHEYENIINARINMDKLNTDYNNDNVSYDDYVEKISQLDTYIANRDIFNATVNISTSYRTKNINISL